MRRLFRLWILLPLLLLVPAAAEETLSLDCRLPEQQIAPDNAYREVYDKAEETAKALCGTLMDIYEGGAPLAGSSPDEKVRRQLGAFGSFAAESLKEDFNGSGPIKLHANVDEMADQLAATNLATGIFPRFETAPAFEEDAGYEGYFQSGRVPHFTFPEDDAACRRVDSGKNCKEVFEDFKGAFNAYRSFYDAFVSERNAQLLRNLNRDWDRFLEHSKSQTPLEVWLTTLWHRDHFKRDHIVGPPASQLIALHPQVVYEYVGGADEGSRAEFGMAVEWIGINFWDWKLPLGLSVASVYTDRAGASDVRTGVMLHIDNRYAVGWGKGGDDEGFYLTLDLLKMVEDKKRTFERYVD